MIFKFVILLVLLFSCSKKDESIVQEPKTVISNSKQKKKTRIDSIKQARKELFANVKPPNGKYKKKKFNSMITATFKTDLGEMIFELFPKYAPIAVENFVNLAHAGFYKNNQFFRVIDGFVIQAGDPSNTGTGTAGYYFPSEPNIELSHDRIGMLSYANFDKNTNSSQFFITLSGQSHLDANHPLFGKILKGIEILKKIGSADTGENDKPVIPINIIDVTIQGI